MNWIISEHGSTFSFNLQDRYSNKIQGVFHRVQVPALFIEGCADLKHYNYANKENSDWKIVE